MLEQERLVQVLKRLRLSGLLQSLEIRQREADAQNFDRTTFLYWLLQDEVDRREGKQLDTRVRRARFDQVRTLEEFDYQFNGSIPREKILQLGTCTFLKKAENVIFVGPTGTGKSHLAQALGHRACRLGQEVMYQSAQDLFVSLRSGRGDGSYDKKLSRLASVDVLIVDDLGLRQLREEEPYDFHEIVRRRHEKRSTLLTSNRDVDEWGGILGESLLTAATMDRLLQGAHVVRLVGDSYRNPPPEKRRRGKVAAT